MSRRRVLGIALIVVGVVFIASGYRYDPPRTLWIVAGMIFIISGTLRTILARNP